MESVSLSCGHCGAPLEVPAGTRFVTCAFCSARLEVHQSGNALYTSVLGAIETNTEKIAGDLDTIKTQNELERCDREWAQEREGYMVHGKDGTTATPSAAGSLIAAAVAGGFGILWTVITFTISASAPHPLFYVFPMFGLIFVAAAIVMGISGITKAQQYEQGQADYQRRRRRLLGELESKEHPPRGDDPGTAQQTHVDV
jgi:LSD1 subclass zinc finger protein